jgi:hypothetical protein
LRFVGRQRGGGLVHDEDAGLERDRLGDLDGLLGTDGQRVGRCPRIEVDVKGTEDLAGLVVHLPPAHEPPPPAVAHEDVLGDAQVGEDHRLLVDRHDAVVLRISGRAQRDELAVDAHLAGVGLVDAGHRLDERRLAGAVLADQGVDLPGEELDACPLQRPGRPELLRDVGQRHHGHA